MTPRHLLQAAATLGGLALVATALITLADSRAGLEITHHQVGATPVRVYRGDEAGTQVRPHVVIAHGFAGSQQLMEPFATTMARQGFVAVTFDFLGHGRHPTPLGGDVTKVEGSTQQLLAQTGDVVEFASALSNGAAPLALLGHSMASDVIVRYAQSDPRIAATVAVSMFSPAVTATAPANLLVIDGAWEPYLVREGERILALASAPHPARAGVTYGDLADGSARRLDVAPGVEHISVLYSPAAHEAAARWLRSLWTDASAGRPRPRGGATVRLFLGLILLTWPLAARLPPIVEPSAMTHQQPSTSGRWRAFAPSALIPALTTPLALFWVPSDFLGVLVGGYLVVHFAVYGVTTWLCTRRWPPGPKRTMGAIVAPRAVLAIALAVLWTTGVFAWALDTWFTSFVPPWPRLPLLAAMGCGTAAYFFADEWLCGHHDVPRGARLATRACFLLSLTLAVALSPYELFFLIIIAVLVAFYFLVYGLFNAWINQATKHPLVAALSSAVAFAWALAVVFPMMTGR